MQFYILIASTKTTHTQTNKHTLLLFINSAVSQNWQYSVIDDNALSDNELIFSQFIVGTDHNKIHIYVYKMFISYAYV